MQARIIAEEGKKKIEGGRKTRKSSGEREKTRKGHKRKGGKAKGLTGKGEERWNGKGKIARE